MAKPSSVFACANPVPDIWPWEARAAVVATGRSDFPNPVSNSLCLPGLFRGALDVRAKPNTDERCRAAAHALADMATDHGLDPEYILPTMAGWTASSAGARSSSSTC
jgi:malate dehydrogenase (oxaloacetate-decarboxylating)